MTNVTMPDILATIDGPEAEVAVPETWMQGRAAYGGLGAALAATAMRRALEAEKTLRSIMVSFIGPIPAGTVGVRAELLRQGKNVTHATARVTDGDSVLLQAAAAFGASRETKSVAADIPFRAEARDSVPKLDHTRVPLPGFIQNFDIHWTGGGIPTSGTGDRRLGQWVRHAANMDAFPCEKIIGLADIPPPVVMAHYDRRILASSLTWSLEFVVAPESVKSDWFYLDFTLEAAAGGYSQQSGLIFAQDGTLVAMSRQCMTYFE
jgi:acyl-CoA thioesterase